MDFAARKGVDEGDPFADWHSGQCTEHWISLLEHGGGRGGGVMVDLSKGESSGHGRVGSATEIGEGSGLFLAMWTSWILDLPATVDCPKEASQSLFEDKSSRFITICTRPT